MQKLLGILLPLLFVSSALAAIGDFFNGKSHVINHVSDRIGRHHDHDSQEYDKRHDYDDLKHYISGHDIKFPCQATKNIYVSSGRYEPRNIIANRLQIGRDHAYVAVPRLRTGVPFTLARIHLRKTCSTTLLEPYPCWSIQEEGNCEALQSVVDLVLDEKNILWVLDSGIVNTLSQPIRRCHPKVLGICTITHRVVRRIDLSDVVEEDTRLQHILVDYDAYGHSYIYISDSGTGVILVHNSKEQKNCRVVLPGDCVPSTKDILYMVLVRRHGSCPFVYFTYLHSDRLYYIRSEHLRRGTGSGSVVEVARKPKAAMILLGTDNGCGVFLRFRGDGDIYRWDAETCFKEDNLELIQSGGDCRLSTQVAPGFRRFMWTIESNFPDYVNKACGCYGASISIRPLIGCDDDD